MLFLTIAFTTSIRKSNASLRQRVEVAHDAQSQAQLHLKKTDEQP